MRKSQSDCSRFKSRVGGIASRNMDAKKLMNEMVGSFPPRKPKEKQPKPECLSCVCQKNCVCKFCSCEIKDGDWMFKRHKKGNMPEVSACYTCGERVFKKK